MSESSWTPSAKLASLHPDLRPLIERLIGRMYVRGFAPMIYFGWRSLATQAKLHAGGTSGVRTSFHNHTEDGEPAALAADIVDAELWWNNPEFFIALGEEAEAVGLVWGGRWNNPDSAHVQLWPNSRLDEVVP